MTQLILIRPGSTDYDDQKRIQGNLSVPLNAQGSSEVAKAIDQLRGKSIKAVYSCVSEPAMETARAVATALDLKLKKLDQMQNLNHGLWQGMQVDEVKRKHPKLYRQWQERPENVRPPEGETIDEVRERVRGTLTKLLKKHKRDVVAIVVPEPLASVVKSVLKKAEVGDLWKASDEHGHWEIIDVEAKELAATR